MSIYRNDPYTGYQQAQGMIPPQRPDWMNQAQVHWQADQARLLKAVKDGVTYEQLPNPIHEGAGVPLGLPKPATGEAPKEDVEAFLKSFEKAPEGPLTTDSASRKAVPLGTFLLEYFPLAFVAMARLSKAANDKHNPNEPMHWSREKSNDHLDCLMRHLMEHDKVDPEDGELHVVKVAWRACAMAQLALEKRK